MLTKKESRGIGHGILKAAGAFALALAFTLSGNAQGRPGMQVVLNDGTSHTYFLNEKPVLKFADGKCVATSSNPKDPDGAWNFRCEYAVPDIKHVQFGTDFTVGVAETGAENVCLDLTREGEIRVIGARAGSLLKVYDISGKLLSESRVNENGEGVAYLTAMQPQGVYVVAVDEHKFKFFRK